MQFSKSILIAAVAMIAPLAMNADSINAPSSLTLDSLTFSNFTCSVTSPGGAKSTPNNCGQISATIITTPGEGIQFSSGFLATRGAFEDADLGYSVSSTSGITSVGLYFNGYFEGLGITSVTETVFHGSNLVGQLTVSCGANGCSPADEYQTIALDGSYTDLNIQKDIQVNSNGSGSSNYAGLSIVDQTFTTATPEPASMALFGIGLLAAGVIRRRTAKA